MNHLFLKKHKNTSHTSYLAHTKGFGLIELLIVIAIIGSLASVVVNQTTKARENAYFVRSKKEFNTLNEALQMYIADNGNTYPADVSRGLPPGLERYLPGGDWPAAPWPDSVYDWDVWTDPDDGPRIVQISIRFCPAGSTSTSTCRFPREQWAANFGVNSAVYYCLQGACRSHISEPITYPYKCMNCIGTSTSVDK